MTGRNVAALAALVALFFICAVVGGGTGAIDSTAAAGAVKLLAASPLLLDLSLLLTEAGSAPVTLGLAAASALLLAFRKDYRRSAILLVAVIAERLAVDGLKLFFARARPLFDQDLVQVYNLSFPSGHAANSLTAYLLTAWFVAPPRFRLAALIVALALAVLIGLTRIVIGVHWLTDVIGGWAVGLIAIMLALAAERRLAARQQ
jgi:membrane-associated phospholipid phosphatase